MAEGGNIVPTDTMSDTIAAMEDGYTKNSSQYMIMLLQL